MSEGAIKGLKIAGKMFGAFVLFVVVLGLVGNLLPAPPKGTIATAEKPVVSDKELITQFYQQLRPRIDQADGLYKPFATSLKQGDILGATRFALQIKQPISDAWGQIDQLKVPDLTDEESKKKLEQAKQSLSLGYLYRVNLVKGLIDLSESPNTKKLAEMLNTKDESDSLLYHAGFLLGEVSKTAGVNLKELK